ncbi:response regulator transcription factor [Danxiaibacter flavus]|uniref:Response regulator transcription factor n=1 Tax=Danxiaibacter flavus TaxID=3049108 RepID=A0ABV3ZHZ8_9BACT|nr:response regulator transcription factor [Chitinophagaceae bacterium DXS]
MKVLLVDDHMIIRQSLLYILQSQFPPVLCFEARTGEECTTMLKKENFDLLILDLTLPDTDGIALTEWIMQRNPHQKILFFSTSPTEVFAKRLYQMGIMGYINKQAPISEISNALYAIIRKGEKYVNEEFKAMLTQSDEPEHDIAPLERLSKRELSIAQLLANGKSIEAIAATLNVETTTIRTHKARIFQKLEITSFPEFLQKARQYKLI